MVDHRREMQRLAKRAAKAATDRYKEQHPEAMRLDMKADVWVYNKKPSGYSNHRHQIVELMLVSKLYLQQTNSQITALLSDKYAPYKIPGNVMTRRIPPKAREKIEAMLRQHGKMIDLKTHDTLSKIKKALRANAVSSSSDRRYETVLAFSDDSVLVGGRTFPVNVHAKGYRRIRLEKEWLRCDVLEAIIKAGGNAAG